MALTQAKELVHDIMNLDPQGSENLNLEQSNNTSEFDDSDSLIIPGGIQTSSPGSGTSTAAGPHQRRHHSGRGRGGAGRGRGRGGRGTRAKQGRGSRQYKNQAIMGEAYQDMEYQYHAMKDVVKELQEIPPGAAAMNQWKDDQLLARTRLQRPCGTKEIEIPEYEDSIYRSWISVYPRSRWITKNE